VAQWPHVDVREGDKVQAKPKPEAGNELGYKKLISRLLKHSVNTYVFFLSFVMSLPLVVGRSRLVFFSVETKLDVPSRKPPVSIACIETKR
jgi:hypothetical protein